MSKTPTITSKPAYKADPVTWPICGATEEKLLLEAFRSGNWWYGEKVQEFEQRFAEMHDAKFGITCTNGTIALELALRALGVGPGDEVIVPDYTFIATAGAVVGVGAIPRFADVDGLTANIDFDSAEALVNEHTRAIIVVHFAGLPVDMQKAREFADRHKIKLIEDAAHAWGSKWDGQGAGSIGDAGTFSFQVTKNITSGEGGIVLTNDPEIAKIVRSYTNCGRFEGHAWYEHFVLGGNNRMTEFQAAILLGQLDRLLEQVNLRERNAAILNRELRKIPGINTPVQSSRVDRRSYHLFLLDYNEAEFDAGLNKTEFIAGLCEEGLPAVAGYLCPVHANHCFVTLNDSPRQENAWLAGQCNERGIRFGEIENPVATRLCDESMIWLPHTLLLGTEQEMEQVVDAVLKVRKKL